MTPYCLARLSGTQALMLMGTPFNVTVPTQTSPAWQPWESVLEVSLEPEDEDEVSVVPEVPLLVSEVCPSPEINSLNREPPPKTSARRVVDGPGNSPR